MPDKWIVLVEAAGDAASGTIDSGSVERLLEALDPGPQAIALHTPKRYALQVMTTASSPSEALFSVLSRWDEAVRRLALPAWEVVRSEILTPEEFELDMQNHERPATSIGGLSSAPRQTGDDIGHELLRQAFSDPLTGLLTEEAFNYRLERALAESGGQRPAAVLYLDLDAFHAVNDRFTHATGDCVLIAVAERLTATLRPGDSLARVGSDEYAFIVEDATEEAAVTLAERILDTLSHPFNIRDHEITLSASAGIALSGPGEGVQHVTATARAALRLAKDGGGSRQVLFSPAVSQPSQPSLGFGTDVLQDRLAHLVLMQGAAVAANEADTLDQAAQIVMRQVCAHVDCAIGHLWVPPADSSGVLPPAPMWHVPDGRVYDAFREATEELAFTAGVDLPGRVLASGRPVWISNVAAEPDFPRRPQAEAAGLDSAFAFPVIVGSEVVAVLEFFSRTSMDATGSFLDVLTGIGTQLGRVVERHRADVALRHSEQRVRESEARLRQAQAMARLGSWHFDLRTGEGSWSDELYALYGLDPTEPAPGIESALARVHSTDRVRARAALTRLMQSGERTVEEVRILRSDGQVRWHCSEGSAIADENGVVVAIHGTAQDITERKLVEEALREREQQLAEAQRVARLGWWEWELETDRLIWSDELCRLWGLEPGWEPSPDAFFAALHPDDRERLLELAAELRQTGAPSSMDFRAVVADGRQVVFRSGAHLHRDERGTPVKLFGTAQDITEEKDAEEALRAAHRNPLDQEITA